MTQECQLPAVFASPGFPTTKTNDGAGARGGGRAPGAAGRACQCAPGYQFPADTRSAPHVGYSAAASVTITSCVRPSRKIVSSTVSPGAFERIDTINSVDSSITSPLTAVMTSPS